jgi:hypothetical protein
MEDSQDLNEQSVSLSSISVLLKKKKKKEERKKSFGKTI